MRDRADLLIDTGELNTNQLRSLEQARTSQPNEASLRFLLGYHYGFLGYPSQAVVELDKATAIEPKVNEPAQLKALFTGTAMPSTAVPSASVPAQPATPMAPPTIGS